jgi:fatty-acyl-CoA synthase
MRAGFAPLQDAGLHAFADALQFPGPVGDNAVQPSDLAVLPYTSGTTGHPKGCCHTHSTVLASNIGSQVWRGLHADAVFLCVAPLFHMLGMQNGMNMPMTLGATVVMLPRWDAAQAVAAVARYRVTVWTAPPAMVIDFFAQPSAQTADLSSLALLSGGGAAMPEAVAHMLFDKFGLSYNEAYGLSETAAFLHANPVARGKRQCLGVPTPGVDSRIIDPETLQELPQGEVGELVTRGAQVMQGYWQNPQADHAAFIELDGHRFFRTGDLALVDEEGYFFMRDRLKRMINASGLKVWPAEVENTLYSHPAVHEACVIAVPDAKRGETVMALLVLKPAFAGTLTEQDFIDWARQQMAVYKAPRLVRFMDSLPKSGTGKIMWRQLQEDEKALRGTQAQTGGI